MENMQQIQPQTNGNGDRNWSSKLRHAGLFVSVYLMSRSAFALSKEIGATAKLVELMMGFGIYVFMAIGFLCIGLGINKMIQKSKNPQISGGEIAAYIGGGLLLTALMGIVKSLQADVGLTGQSQTFGG